MTAQAHVKAWLDKSDAWLSDISGKPPWPTYVAGSEVDQDVKEAVVIGNFAVVARGQLPQASAVVRTVYENARMFQTSPLPELQQIGDRKMSDLAVLLGWTP